jgi:hypothetical protein
MDATTVATAGVQVEPGIDPIERVFARLRTAQQLWFISAALDDLRAAPRVDVAKVNHYERERIRLSRELEVLQA